MADTSSAAAAFFTARDIIYIAAVVVAVYSAKISTRSANKSEKRDLNSLGDSEIKTFEMIAKAEKDFAEFNAKVIDKKEAHEAVSSNPPFELSLGDHSLSDFYTQSVLNAYEIACQRYLDEKLDSERFKKTYSARLKVICTTQAYKPAINSGDFSYSALTQVNSKLNDPHANQGK